MHILCALNYIYTCLCILIYDIYVMFISSPPLPPPEMGFSIQKGSWRLGHFSLQVVSICRSIGVFFWDLAYFLCKWGSSWGKNEKLCCQKAGIQRLRDSAGGILWRKCSLRWVQSIPDNQLIIFTCCKNNCRSCNVGLEKLPLVHATYVLPYTF